MNDASAIVVNTYYIQQYTPYSQKCREIFVGQERYESKI